MTPSRNSSQCQTWLGKNNVSKHLEIDRKGEKVLFSSSELKLYKKDQIEG